MRSVMIGLVVILSTSSISIAGGRQEQRIEELEAENYRLTMEISRLRQRIVEMQKAEANRRRWAPYGYSTRRPLAETNQTLRDIEQTQRSLKNLGR